MKYTTLAILLLLPPTLNAGNMGSQIQQSSNDISGDNCKRLCDELCKRLTGKGCSNKRVAGTSLTNPCEACWVYGIGSPSLGFGVALEFSNSAFNSLWRDNTLYAQVRAIPPANRNSPSSTVDDRSITSWINIVCRKLNGNTLINDGYIKENSSGSTLIIPKGIQLPTGHSLQFSTTNECLFQVSLVKQGFLTRIVATISTMIASITSSLGIW